MALTVLDSYVVADGVKSKTGLYCELPLALARAAMEKLKTDKNIFKFLIPQITGGAYGRPRS